MTVQILQGDCRQLLATLPAQSVNCVVTSPPYYAQRDYAVDGQIGLEATPEAYIAELVAVFRAAGRVLRDDGTAWLNLGDTMVTNGGSGWQGKNGDRADRRFTQQRGGTDRMRGAMRGISFGLPPKNMLFIPQRVAMALQADGWYCRQDIVWFKPNTMPESVEDRCTKSHEFLFLLTKQPVYYFDAEAIAEPSVNFGQPVEKGTDASGFKDARLYGGKHSNPKRAGNRKTFRGGGAYTHDQAFDNSRPSEGDSHGNEPNLSGMRNKRDVWTVATRSFDGEFCCACKAYFHGANLRALRRQKIEDKTIRFCICGASDAWLSHFATFPPDLVEPCILAGCPEGGTVLDPFGGAGTTALVADRLQRNAVLCELNADYALMARARVDGDAGLFKEAAE